MYRCEITGKVSEPNQPLNRVVVLKREKVYTKWVKDEETNRWSEVEAGHGHETVRELSLSPEGVHIWESWSDEDKNLFLQSK